MENIEQEIKEKLENNSHCDTLRYNLHNRSLRLPASSFKWNNPEEADGVPILARGKVSDSDPNIKIAYDNFSLIANMKAGYLASNITRVYGDEIDDQVKAKYQEFDRINNFQAILKKMCSYCAMWGVTYSLCYLDHNNIVRFKNIDAWKAKIDYDEETGEPEYGFLYYKKNKQQIVKVYDKINVSTYYANKDSGNYSFIEQKAHGFTEIPLIEWKNNDQLAGNSQKAAGLIDAYDCVVSDVVTELDTFRNAYLLLKNVGRIDEKAKAELRKTGVIAVDGDGDVKFLTKDINPQFVEFVSKEVWAGIWVVACSVDPKAVGTLQNATAFQISQMYKLMEEDAKNTEIDWLVSLEYFDRVLKSYWVGLDVASVGEYSTYDIDYIFNRNIPKDAVSDLESIKRAGGSVPQREIFKRAFGVDEKTADEWVQLASDEMTANLPDFGGE